MIKGVSFRIEQCEHEKVLFKIFQFIDVKKYNWYNVLDQNEVWKNFEGEKCLKEEYYSGNEFENVINSEHYVLFLKLQAYQKTVNYQNLHTYKEFAEDNCQLLVLVSDSEFVEIYAKELPVLKNIYGFAEQNAFFDMEYITDDNDSRTVFNIL